MPRGIANSERFAQNPFRSEVIKSTITGTRAIYASPSEENTFAMVSRATGEDFGDIAFGKRIKVDKTHFLKVYANGIKMFLNLKPPGIKVFMLIFDKLMQDENYQADNVDLVYNMLDDVVKNEVGRTTFFKGIKELRDAHFLAPSMQDGKYWINCDYVFRGNRLTLVNEYILQDEKQAPPKAEAPLSGQLKRLKLTKRLKMRPKRLHIPTNRLNPPMKETPQADGDEPN